MFQNGNIWFSEGGCLTNFADEGVRATHELKKEKGAEGIRAFFYVLFSE
jgi:hypothetical protein